MQFTPATVRRALRGVVARPRWLLAVAFAFGLSGCAEGELRRIPRGQEHPTFSTASTVARHQREDEMNRIWQNRPLGELVAELGRPKMVMNIPGGGMPPSFAVVYGPDPGTGCIDAFAISSRGDPVVRIYHCR
jgi:hypothetical protein